MTVLTDVGPATYKADGADVAIFTVEVVDAAGVVVPDACVPLTFTTSGPGSVYGVGNGDPADHTPDKVGLPDLPYGGVWKRNAFMGLARAIVQTARVPKAGGVVTLTVESEGLKAGSASFTSVAV